jgi:hypothetical protein
MTPNLNNFLVYNAIFPIQHVLLGDDNKHPITGENTMSTMTSKGKFKEIDVLHVPSLTRDLT